MKKAGGSMGRPPIRKGFISSVEALFALLVFLIIIVILVLPKIQEPSKNLGYLRAINMDVLTSLEKTGALQNYSEEKPIRDVLVQLPNSVCMEITFTSSANGTLSSIKKPGCEDLSARDLAVTYRTVWASTWFGTATATSWSK